MTTMRAKQIDIAGIIEVNSEATYIFVTDGEYAAEYEDKIEDLLKLLEDEEDAREGLKALADEGGTITWEQYQHQREERELRGELQD